MIILSFDQRSSVSKGCLILDLIARKASLKSAIPGESKSNRLNTQAIPPKSLRKEIFQDADIKGKNSSPGIAALKCLYSPSALHFSANFYAVNRERDSPSPVAPSLANDFRN